MRMRGFVAVVVAVLVTAGISGCAPEPKATVMRTPRIVWRDGRMPSSPLEAHPAVKGLRAATVGRAMAWNSGDFTIRQLTENYRYQTLQNIVQQYNHQGDDPWVFRGPLPFEPVKVTKQENGSYEVTVCALPYRDWAIAKPGHDWSAEPAGAYLQEWDIDDYHRDGHYVVIGGGGGFRTPCDASTIPVGFFDPQPVLPKGPVTTPKRSPLPEPPGTPYPGNTG